MMYAIQVTARPLQTPGAHTAYQFIKAALMEGHEINRVFFYHDGVYNGFGAGVQGGPAVPDWSDLAARYGIDLVLCVSAAERRGLCSDSGVPFAGRCLEGFRIGGLGLWMEACLKADRLLVFGA